MKALAHVATVLIVLAVTLGIPTLRYVDVGALLSGGIDTISSATTIQAAPSGSYTVLINKDLHTDEETLAQWVDFFEGKDVSLIMEDISCVALSSDAAGLDMATSLQSRLPENQMSVRTENAVLALSKAEQGVFDTIVMSDEAAAQYTASTVYNMDNVVVVHR